MKHITDKDFDLFVNTDRKVIQFSAGWCGPCKMLEKTINAMQSSNQDVEFAKFEIDSSHDIASRYSIRSVPTVIYFKGGKEADRIIGAKSTDKLQEFIDSCKAK